jgi:hypothetical protein
MVVVTLAVQWLLRGPAPMEAVRSLGASRGGSR